MTIRRRQCLEPSSGPHVRCRLRGPLTSWTMDGVQGVQRLVLDYPGIYLDLDLSEVEEVDETGILFLHGLKRRVIAIGGRITLHSVSGGVAAVLRRSDMDGTLIGTFE